MKIRVKKYGKKTARPRAVLNPPARWAAVGTLAVYTVMGSRLTTSVRADDAAEDAAKAAPQTQQPVRRFDIAAGPLDAAITAFQDATGLTVQVPAGVGGFATSGVSGVFTSEQALKHLLSGTGIAYRFVGQDRVRLEVRTQESVVVTGSANAPASPKYTEPLRDLPQTITVIPASVMEEQNATTLRDVLRNVPGLTIQAGEGGVPAGDNLTIRGFSARTDMFVDGVRDFGGYSRDPYNFDQVEVTKGPASSFAGRGSTGGSINMVSKAPRVRTDRGATIGLGNESYKRGTLDVNQSLEGAGWRGAAFRLNAMWTDTDVARRDEVKNSRWGVAPSLAFGLGTPTRFIVSYAHLDQDNVPDYGIPWVPVTALTGPLASYNGTQPPVESSNFYGILDRDYEKTKTDLSTAVVEHDFGSSLVLRNQLRYGRSNRDSVITAPRFVDPNSPVNYTQINRQLQSRDMLDTVLSNQTNLTWRLTTGSLRHAVITGIELGTEGSTNHLRTGPIAPLANLFEPNPDDPYPGPVTRTGAVNDGTADSLALYAFDTINLGQKFEVSGGLRYDHFAVDYDQTAVGGVVTPFSRTDDMPSWRAGLVYKPQAWGSVYFGLGTSFNPSAEGLSLAANNVNLPPEKSTSYELGTKWDLFGRHLAATAAVFHTDKTNARTPGVDPGDPPLVLEGEQSVEGIELGATGNIGQHVSIFAGYAHMSSEIESSNTPAEVGKALPQTPEDTFNLWLTLRLPKNITLGLGAQYMDLVYRNTLNTLTAPSYWLMNATAAYEVNRKLTLRFNAYNLADADYVDRVGGGHYVPGPGRYAMLTADVKF